MKESRRQQNWLEKGYTKEQIENHLKFERRKSKESRERRKRNNNRNAELITRIKNDLLGKTFGNVTILSIRPTTDGAGFWYKMHKTFKDGSNGDYRYFYSFDEFSLSEFIENTNL